MARNTIQKSFVTTQAHGFALRNDVPEPVVIEIDGKLSLEAAQRKIRKTEPSFMCAEVDHLHCVYTMSYEDFRKYGTASEITEE